MAPPEIAFKQDQANLLLDVLQRTVPSALGHLVEVGAGEGFFLAAAERRGLKYAGVDFNKAQLAKMNSACGEHFVESSDPVGAVVALGERPTCIVLRHVIEHVPDAVELVQKLSQILPEGGALVIEAPHDYKPLQAHLMANDRIEKEYWLAFPDHLSYFSPETLEDLLRHFKFEVKETYADFPIELLLLSPVYNYQKNKEAGKPAHLLRCEVTHYLYQNTPVDELLPLYRAFARCKIGRSFTMIVQKGST
jgi:SAM-dependent methyltransferase